MTAAPDQDPFAGGDSAPSISFKDAAIGTVFTGVVTETARMVQSRDYTTGDLATWPDGNPKMAAVFNMTVDGEERSVWASKPSALFGAIKEAQVAVGSRIEVGDTVSIKYSGDKPNSNPRLNAQKLYQARITKGTPAPAADAFGDAPPF